ncbi:response regulator transcription factor [Robinsoniella peoriensis]|uniref:Heme response regulator HssR n=1 Tax=Robinsoniella peoriensis TaxID=180332 RepID=A0A4U8Q3T8_9FIRM|nr:response regulator transcription factor [Robinsoniella peoriensis]MDU7026905.1 response regulator transcription factor [Clostridiales bacterium]TLC99451.1 Heme response regulator HssR [Robinsoniella peoriensis]
MIRILVVEDDERLNKIVCTYLNDSGFQAKGCMCAAEAYEEMYQSICSMIISDIMMPEIDGFEFARTVRQVNSSIPILFMSAKDDLPSKQKGFRLGIDDYMVKPIELDELLLRVRALLRRANIETERKLAAGNLVMDSDAMTAIVNDVEIPITTREFHILYKLLSYPKKTFTRAQLMDEFWGVDCDTSLRAVDVYVTKLRDKFSGCDGFQIVTVRGIGYKAVLL